MKNSTGPASLLVDADGRVRANDGNRASAERTAAGRGVGNSLSKLSNTSGPASMVVDGDKKKKN